MSPSSGLKPHVPAAKANAANADRDREADGIARIETIVRHVAADVARCPAMLGELGRCTMPRGHDGQCGHARWHEDAWKAAEVGR